MAKVAIKGSRGGVSRRRYNLADRPFTAIKKARPVGRPAGEGRAALAAGLDSLVGGVDRVSSNMIQNAREKENDHVSSVGAFYQRKMDERSSDLLTGKTSPGKMFKEQGYLNEVADHLGISVAEAEQAKEKYRKKVYAGLDYKRIAKLDLRKKVEDYNTSNITLLQSPAFKGQLNFPELLTDQEKKTYKKYLGPEFDLSLMEANSKVMERFIQREVADSLHNKTVYDSKRYREILDKAYKEKKINDKTYVSLIGKNSVNLGATLQQKNKEAREHDRFINDEQSLLKRSPLSFK